MLAGKHTGLWRHPGKSCRVNKARLWLAQGVGGCANLKALNQAAEDDKDRVRFPASHFSWHCEGRGRWQSLYVSLASLLHLPWCSLCLGPFSPLWAGIGKPQSVGQIRPAACFCKRLWNTFVKCHRNPATPTVHGCFCVATTGQAQQTLSGPQA